MASGHASRVDRPNTWLLRPGCAMLKVLANTEPSTHGTKRATSAPQHFGLLSEALPTSWELTRTIAHSHESVRALFI